MTAQAPPLPDAHPITAAFWMCGAIASFTLMAISGREIQAELNSFELMFWRSLIGFAIIGTLVLSLHGRAVWPAIRPTRPRLHLARNIFHFAGQNLWFYGIMAIPLSQLVALEFTSPIWVAVLAPLVVGEVFTRRRLWVAALGFAGILIVAQPGVQPLSSGHLAGILCAVAFAMNLLLTKRIMRHDKVLCVLFWMTASQTLFGLALAMGWVHMAKCCDPGLDRARGADGAKRALLSDIGAGAGPGHHRRADGILPPADHRTGRNVAICRSIGPVRVLGRRGDFRGELVEPEHAQGTGSGTLRFDKFKEFGGA